MLIVEDEREIRRFVRIALEAEAFSCVEVDSVSRALIEAGTRRPELIVLDLGLPDGDGIDFIRELRQWSRTPVIVLSARANERDKVDALDAGADDYLVKPFGVGELLARVRAQMRRAGATTTQSDAVTTFGNVVVDRVRRVVTRGGDNVHLTPIEYRLLTLLMSQPDRVLTHRHLLREVWGPSHVDDSHYLRVHMGNLRKKIEDEPSRPRWLKSEAGVGYRFVPQ